MFIAIGASQGILLLGIAMIVSAAFNAAIWFRVTSQHIGIPMHSFVRTLRQSMVVALMAGIGPMFALWIYGPYPSVLVMPLSLGVAGGIAGFVTGILVFNHPLQEEILPIWLKIKQLTV